MYKRVVSQTKYNVYDTMLVGRNGSNKRSSRSSGATDWPYTSKPPSARVTCGDGQGRSSIYPGTCDELYVGMGVS